MHENRTGSLSVGRVPYPNVPSHWNLTQQQFRYLQEKCFSRAIQINPIDGRKEMEHIKNMRGSSQAMENAMNGVLENYEAEIDLVLSYHKGDVRAAIEALLRDREFLIKEVEYASLFVSHGRRPSPLRRAA